MALLASLLIATFLNPASASDHDHSDLHHHKNRLDRQVKSQRQDVDEVSAQLVRAAARLDTAVSDLRDARDVLSALRVQVHEAAVVDREMQARLDEAIVRLHNARADLESGQQARVDQRSELAAFAMSSYQTGGLGPLSLGLGFDSSTIHAAVDNLQGIDAIGNKQTAALQELEAAEVLLKLTEDRVEDTKRDVRERRVEAAEKLAVKEDLEQQAETAKQEVESRVENLRIERQKVAVAKQHEQHRLNTLEKERDRVADRLRRIAERRARLHHRQMSTPSGGSGFLSYPVRNTYITSPYGMRMHPILHVWKLHDGTDFHADCGTPVYAAAPGRIMSEYYNVGYGNRIILDHGFVKGVSLWTSYNHLTSFVARVGEHVRRGELIAYSGTTGYSTACHLHFMVYVNGGTVDPVTWL
jgi:murein DD-endopeptidase MepM/ murein hydrolase activator NlpD